jgi:hypothetical protein
MAVRQHPACQRTRARHLKSKISNVRIQILSSIRLLTAHGLQLTVLRLYIVPAPPLVKSKI